MLTELEALVVGAVSHGCRQSADVADYVAERWGGATWPGQSECREVLGALADRGVLRRFGAAGWKCTGRREVER